MPHYCGINCYTTSICIKKLSFLRIGKLLCLQIGTFLALPLFFLLEKQKQKKLLTTKEKLHAPVLFKNLWINSLKLSLWAKIKYENSQPDCMSESKTYSSWRKYVDSWTKSSFFFSLIMRPSPFCLK